VKFKATKKLMNQNYYRVMSVGYCHAQHLLWYEEPIAYSTRAKGWACDYYDVDGVLISTGYAPLSSKNTHASYDLVRQYDDMALYYVETDSYIKRMQVKALLREFISKATS